MIKSIRRPYARCDTCHQEHHGQEGQSEVSLYLILLAKGWIKASVFSDGLLCPDCIAKEPIR